MMDVSKTELWESWRPGLIIFDDLDYSYCPGKRLRLVAKIKRYNSRRLCRAKAELKKMNKAYTSINHVKRKK